MAEVVVIAGCYNMITSCKAADTNAEAVSQV